jgi:hypothetical protein
MKEALGKTTEGQEAMKKVTDALSKVMAPLFALISKVGIPVFEGIAVVIGKVAEGFEWAAKKLGLTTDEVKKFDTAAQEAAKNLADKFQEDLDNMAKVIAYQRQLDEKAASDRKARREKELKERAEREAEALREEQERLKKADEDKERRLRLIEQKIDNESGYWSVQAYAKINNIPISHNIALKLGLKASNKSKKLLVPVGKTSHQLYGQVNTYHEDILDTIFEHYINNPLQYGDK